LSQMKRSQPRLRSSSSCVRDVVVTGGSECECRLARRDAHHPEPGSLLHGAGPVWVELGCRRLASDARRPRDRRTRHLVRPGRGRSSGSFGERRHTLCEAVEPKRVKGIAVDRHAAVEESRVEPADGAPRRERLERFERSGEAEHAIGRRCASRSTGYAAVAKDEMMRHAVAGRDLDDQITGDCRAHAVTHAARQRQQASES